MLAAGLILVFGLGFSLTAALLWRSSVRTQERQAFQTAAIDASESLEPLLHRNTDFVAALRTVLTMQPRLSASDFGQWYNGLGDGRQVGGLGTLVIRSVPTADLGAFQARRNANPAFRALVGGRVQRVAHGTSTTFFVPGARSRGYCLLSAGSVSRPYSPDIAKLVQGNWCDPNSGIGGFPAGGTSQAGFMESIAGSGQLLGYPVTAEGESDFFIEGAFYRRGVPLASVAQRRAATLGWVESSFHIPTIISQALGRRRGLVVALYHSNPGEPSELVGRVNAGATAKPFAHDSTLELDGTWIVKIRGAVPISGLSGNVQELLVLVGGAIVSILLSALVLVLGRSRQRALGIVAQKTGELQHQTALARSEQRAREATEQASQAKSEFLSRVSHELRTPLNAILGFAQLLELERLEDSQRESVDQILFGAPHLLGLIDELLDVSRVESGSATLSLEPVEMIQLVADALALCEPMAAEHLLKLESRLTNQPLFVMADQQRLAQVLLNLLTNALKFNRRDGTVTVTAHEEPEGKVRLEVTDTGVGMTDEQQQLLFSPFERLDAPDREIEGTGLGLVLTKTLVEAMGGQINLRSELGIGSTFSVLLLAAEAPAPDDRPDRAPMFERARTV